MKRLLLFFVIVFSVHSFSQELYLNKEFIKGLTKETRTLSGIPGKNFWINSADYNIKAEVILANKRLTGSENIVFHNNSTDTLKVIVFKLYQNLYLPTTVKNMSLTDKDITKGMEITKFECDGKQADLSNPKEYRLDGTVLYFFPAKPLAPGSAVSFNVEWSFTIPSGINIRMGAIDDNSFFLGYWFPRISVYEDLYGWDVYPYEAEHEFYNDFCNFNVEVKVPADYGVWATGTLNNPEEVLSQAVLKKYKTALTSHSIIDIIDSLEVKSAFNNKNSFNIWKYSAQKVTDFAFGISNKYVWQGCSTTIEGREVFVNSPFNPEAKSFYETVPIAKKTIEDLSYKMPAVPYPYPQITVFYGDGGMEYPMIVNDGEFPDRITHIYVTSHEISHMYFPFYTGTNETRHSWIDEGMAYFLPYDIQTSFDPYDHRIRCAKGFSNYAGKETDVPLMTPTMFMREPDLTLLTYYKPALVYEILQDMLGKEMFTKCMKEFIARWNGKHPVPYDFFFTFNNVSGKNLNWYWKPWMFERGIPDNGIKSVNVKAGKLIIEIEKAGELPVPVDVTITFDDNSKEVIHKTAEVWSTGEKIYTVELKTEKKVGSVELGNPIFPDSNPKNNLWKNEK